MTKTTKITTTVKDSVYELAKRRNIKWSFALEFGIRQLARQGFVQEEGVVIVEESVISKKERALSAMQTCIYELNKDIEKLRCGKT